MCDIVIITGGRYYNQSGCSANKMDEAKEPNHFKDDE
jgi:hypothetical protein